MELGSEDERPLKRIRADPVASASGTNHKPTFTPMPFATPFRSAYQEAEAALSKLTLLNRDQAVQLLKNHPEAGELFRAVNAQTALKPEGAAGLGEVDVAIQEIVQEKNQLEAKLSDGLEALEKEKQALEMKAKSSTHLSAKILEQNMTRLVAALIDLRKEVSSHSEIVTKQGKDKEISRLHGLVQKFAEKIVDEFKTSLGIASKMLGQTIALPATNFAAQDQETPRNQETVDLAEASGPEDEVSEEDDVSEYEQQSAKERESTKKKKLYGTEYVDSHPTENFFHRASGRWMKGLPSLEASIFTGVRGPGAKKWKQMKEKFEAKKPKEEKADKPATSKKTEQGATIKAENPVLARFGAMTPMQEQAHKVAAARKIQQLEATVNELQLKLKELRAKLEEEFRARRKAETELANSRVL
ncbi:hypothetical protein PRZ48_003747 [Zasmidium cellare]|uniref:Uncharacterized protein n=1 Tax=Zasmidium cellare TaxID=395010 RepID=A0ABR0EVZ0_ZASCE|nr:hypothetical protein PRZ48_003747 [Zasmidium cellare]